MKLVNYYPADHGWTGMWTDWAPSEFGADMQKISALGANAVRLIVFPSVTGFPLPRASEVAKINDAISIAGTNGLAVQLTLFDGFTNYGDLSGSKVWTDALFRQIVPNPAILLVEVRNEVVTSSPAVIKWVKAEIDIVRKDAPGIPVTVSAVGGLAGMETLKHLLGTHQPDVDDLHFYGDQQSAYETFAAAKAAAMPTPLIVGEAGYSTTGGGPSAATADSSQADWYSQVLQATNLVGLPPAAPWTLYDFTSHGIPYASVPGREYGYGLFHADGSPKQAAAIISEEFHVQSAPSTAQPTTSTVNVSNWQQWYPSGTMRKTTSGGYLGAPMVELSKTGQSPFGATSYFAVPMHAVRSGQVWKAGVWAKTSNADGTNEIVLSWFNSQGTWMHVNDSSQSIGSSADWTELQVSARAPAGATGLRISLYSIGNSGTIAYSDITWSVS
jgi:hypothetical protein